MRKVLRSLPERFLLKVTTIEESIDLDNMRIEELLGSLQTYEYSFPQQNKNKSISLNTVREDSDESFDEYSMSDQGNSLLCKRVQKTVNLYLKKARTR